MQSGERRRRGGAGGGIVAPSGSVVSTIVNNVRTYIRDTAIDSAAAVVLDCPGDQRDLGMTVAGPAPVAAVPAAAGWGAGAHPYHQRGGQHRGGLYRRSQRHHHRQWPGHLLSANDLSLWMANAGGVARRARAAVRRITGTVGPRWPSMS